MRVDPDKSNFRRERKENDKRITWILEPVGRATREQSTDRLTYLCVPVYCFILTERSTPANGPQRGPTAVHKPERGPKTVLRREGGSAVVHKP